MSFIKAYLKNIMRMKKRKRFLASQPNTFELSKREVKKAIDLGFTPEEYVIYDLKNNSYEDYLSEFERMEYRDEIVDVRAILDNKLVCYSLLRNFVSVNKIYAYKLAGDGTCTVLDAVGGTDGLLSLLKESGKLVYKRISLGGGKGFKLLEYKENCYYINRQISSESEVAELFEESDDYLVEEYCCQSDFENQLFPGSVNTIRLITIVHKDNKIEPAVAWQRMGADENNCVDNACAGGLYAEINMQDGKMSAARSHSKDKIGKDFARHPITGALIEGVSIPNWDSIKNEIVSLHQRIRFTGFKFIAWDVALTENGIRIIEANASCSMDFLQTFNSQRNRKIGVWMKEWGYLK